MMKKYEKPIVLENQEMSEGVYAASGVSSDCWQIISIVATDNIVQSDSSREFQIDAIHYNSSDNHYADVILTIEFSQTITSATSTSGLVTSVSGNTVVLSRTFETNNNGEKWGFALRVVCDSPETVMYNNAYITCK